MSDANLKVNSRNVEELEDTLNSCMKKNIRMAESIGTTLNLGYADTNAEFYNIVGEKHKKIVENTQIRKRDVNKLTTGLTDYVEEQIKKANRI